MVLSILPSHWLPMPFSKGWTVWWTRLQTCRAPGSRRASLWLLQAALQSKRSPSWRGSTPASTPRCCTPRCSTALLVRLRALVLVWDSPLPTGCCRPLPPWAGLRDTREKVSFSKNLSRGITIKSTHVIVADRLDCDPMFLRHYETNKNVSCLTEAKWDFSGQVETKWDIVRHRIISVLAKNQKAHGSRFKITTHGCLHVVYNGTFLNAIYAIYIC